jgi:hypothetical protein
MDIERLIHSTPTGLGQLPTPPPDPQLDEEGAKVEELNWTEMRLHSAPMSRRQSISPAVDELPADTKPRVEDFQLLRILGYAPPFFGPAVMLVGL